MGSPKKSKTQKKSSITSKKKTSSSKQVTPFVSKKKVPLFPEVIPSVPRGGESTIRAYLHRISRIPMLTKEEEYKLTVRYHETKDVEIAQKLIQSNLRFVVKIASEYSRFNSRIMDLIQEGNIGLLKAVHEFNPYKGARLITYAVWWIRGYIQEYLIRHHSIVRLGTNKKQRKLFYLLQKEKQALDQFDRSKLLPAIALSTQSTEKEVEEMEQLILKKDLSFDKPLKSDSASTFLDLQASNSLSIEDELSLQEQGLLLRKHLKKMEEDLNEKEKLILKNRLLRDPPATLQEVANEFGVTREAIRQVEQRLFKKLREKLIPILKKSY